ncbi:MAG TPA: type II toxin-antitoxin system VapC family toxin [Steroidobacteraceae bacterium]|jgi:PIN domain nuclease of toxin-antitoxin system
MRVLLDTHLLLWALASPAKLSKRARQRIDSGEVYASAASIWEISIKCALGKLAADPAEILAGIEPAGFNLLPITGSHAAKVVQLPPIHKDAFDRLLVAQARCEPMILLTDDAVLGGYGDFVEVV